MAHPRTEERSLFAQRRPLNAHRPGNHTVYNFPDLIGHQVEQFAVQHDQLRVQYGGKIRRGKA